MPITFSESDGVPFIDGSTLEDIGKCVFDDKIQAKNTAKIYEKHFKQPFGVVELKSVVGG